MCLLFSRLFDTFNVWTFYRYFFLYSLYNLLTLLWLLFGWLLLNFLLFIYLDYSSLFSHFQMLDMIMPQDRTKISLHDLKSCRMTPIFFDTFFNLEKYLDHEQRDPFASQRETDEDGNEVIMGLSWYSYQYNRVHTGDNSSHATLRVSLRWPVAIFSLKVQSGSNTAQLQ